MCHSVNLAIAATLQSGAVTSASAMVPCAWFPEAAEFCRMCPQFDIGVHLTLTCEWRDYKWRPVSSVAPSSKLVDRCGYFHESATQLTDVPVHEIRTELDAQIALARAAGMSPTHIDSHAFSLASPTLIEVYLSVAESHQLSPLLNPFWHTFSLHRGSPRGACVKVDRVFVADPDRTPPSRLEDCYMSFISQLKPGLSELLVHPGFDCSELEAITKGHEAFGSQWRQRDFDILSSARFRDELKRARVHLVNWGTIRSSGAP